MKSDNIYKKLRFLALCLAIICMILSLFKRVNAAEHESIDDYFWNNYFMNDLTTYNIDLSTYNNYLQIIKNQSTGALRYEDSTTIQYRFIRLTDYAGFYMQGLNWSSGAFRLNDPTSTDYNPCILQNHTLAFYDGMPNNYTFGASINIGKNGQVQFRLSYTSRNTKDSQMSRSGHIIPTNESVEIVSNIVASVGETVTTNNLINGSTGTQHPEIYYSNYNNWLTTGLVIYGDLLVMSRYNDGYPAIVYENYVAPPSENTDGLKVYKQTIHNTSYLYIDYSDCVNIVPTYLETSSVFGNIDIDGTIYEIDYDSSSQYYHINIGTEKVYYQIPFSSLSLNDENIESAVLNDLEISVAWSTTLSQDNESLIWLTPIYLIGSPHNNPGYTPDSSSEQPQLTYTPEMNAEYYLEIYSMYNDGHTGDPFKYNENLNLYSSHQLALDSIKMQADILEMDTWYISSVDKELYASNTDLFGDYIYDNGFGLFYDAIVFDVYDRHVDGVVNPVNIYKGTGVLYTEKYYTRNGLNTLTDSLKDVIQYDKMCSDYLYLLYDVTWKKLKSIDYNIADYFTKQGNVSSQIILILENINSFLPDIKGIMDDILDALKNLQLSQLDAIDSKLTTIINNISTPDTPFNEDDTVAEAIKYYESHNNNGVPTGQVYIDDKMSIWISGKVHLWLQGTDANTDKTNLINSVFETLTSIYDSMKNNNDIFPNIQYYLDAIAKNNNYGYETHGDFMTRFFKGNVDISTYNGISE